MVHSKKDREEKSKYAKEHGFGKWMKGRKNHHSEKHKEELSKQWEGSKNPRYVPNGSKHLIGQRYIMIKINGKWVREHIYLLEQKIRRKLRPNEVVHHINGISIDNRIENLKLMTKREHKRLHGKIIWKSNPKFNRSLN